MEKGKWVPEGLLHFFQKKNVVLILGLIGITLLMLSELLPAQSAKKAAAAEAQSATSAEDYVQTLEKRLTEMIAHVEGAGAAEVLITLETDGETVYAQDGQSDEQLQTDETGGVQRQNSRESSHVLVNGANGEAALVEQSLLPQVRGVAVLCEGGDNVAVVADVTELVSVVLDLSTNRICVTKMRDNTGGHAK